MKTAKSKILLINPPFYKPFGLAIPFLQLGLLSLGAALKCKGYRVSVYDADLINSTTKEYLRRAASIDYPFSVNLMQQVDQYKARLFNLSDPAWKEVESVIKKFSPDIVGIGFTTDKYKSACNVAKIAKKINPQITVIVGGPHPTALPQDTIQEAEFDFLVRGEAEATLPELIAAIDAGKDLTLVPGVTFKYKTGVISTPERPLIKNLDLLPFADRSLLVNERDIPSDVMGNLITSRGCAYGCTFCASNKIWGREVRYRSAQTVIQEINQIIRRYKTRNFIFWDDTFTADPERAIKICDLLIKYNLKIRWACQTRVDNVYAALLDKMRQAGLETICFGLESGDPDMLRQMKKGIKLQQVRDACALAKSKGIKVLTSFMIGYPQEDEYSLQRTVDLANELKPDYLASAILIPYPGTLDYENFRQKKIILAADWCEYIPENHNIILRPNITPEKISQALTTLRSSGLVNKKITMRRNITFARIITVLVRDIFSPPQLWLDFCKYKIYKKELKSS